MNIIKKFIKRDNDGITKPFDYYVCCDIKMVKTPYLARHGVCHANQVRC